MGRYKISIDEVAKYIPSLTRLSAHSLTATVEREHLAQPYADILTRAVAKKPLPQVNSQNPKSVLPNVT